MDYINEIKVSIIIPVYNNEEFLPKCLNSVLSQTLEEIEVICINDGSTDHSLDILQECQKNDRRVSIYSIPNSGSGRARNVGIRKAKGKYVAFMDSDDWYFDSEVLQSLFLMAEEKNVEICGGSVCRYTNGHMRSSFNDIDFFKKDGYIKFEEYQNIWGYTRFIYKTTLLRENHIYFHNYLRYQDPPFMLDAMLSAGVFYAIKKKVYCIRSRPGHVNWTRKKICDCLTGKAYVLCKSRQYKLENLHIAQVNQFLGELKVIDISISDLKDKKIRDAIERMHREIDYELVYRKGILKRYENIKTKAYVAILIKTIDRNWVE